MGNPVNNGEKRSTEDIEAILTLKLTWNIIVSSDNLTMNNKKPKIFLCD